MGGAKPLLTVGRRTMRASVIAALDVPHGADGDPAGFAAFGLSVLSAGRLHGHGRRGLSSPDRTGRPL
jgi:hypothetical protein